MIYKIEFKKKTKKIFDKLDISVKLRIIEYLEKVASSEKPRAYGKKLSGNLKGYTSFRVANKYRIVAEIKDSELVIYVVAVAKREIVYDDIE